MEKACYNTWRAFLLTTLEGTQMDQMFLPVLSHFQNGNFWTASAGRMNYRVTPSEDKLTAEVWEGPWCYQLSRVEEKTEFPMDEEGLKAITDWAAHWRDEINARPPRSLADTLAARAEAQAGQQEKSE